MATGPVRWFYGWPITSEELIWFEGAGRAKLTKGLDSAGLAAFDLGRPSLAGVPSHDPWRREKTK